MYILLIILIVFLAFLAALLLFKVRVVIDSEEGVFEIKQGVLYKIQAFQYPDNPVKIKLRILGIPMSIDPMKIAEKRKKKKIVNQKKKSKARIDKSKRRKLGFRQVMGILQDSIKVKYLYISIDSGDFVHNAQLFPAVYTLNESFDDRYWFEINFIGENYLKTHIESRPVWFAIAFIKSKFNTSKS